MKKLFLAMCCIFWAGTTSYASGRKLPVLDEYDDVEITQITYRGISIVHRYGGCTIDVEKLSDKAKELLKEELEIYRKRQEEYKQQQEERQRQLKEASVDQAKQVEDAIKKAKDVKNSNQALMILQQAMTNNPYAINRALLQEELTQARKTVSRENAVRVQRRKIVLEKAKSEVASMYYISATFNGMLIPEAAKQKPTGHFSIVKEFQQEKDEKILYGYHVTWNCEMNYEKSRMGDGEWKTISRIRYYDKYEMLFAEENDKFVMKKMDTIERKSEVRPVESNVF